MRYFLKVKYLGFSFQGSQIQGDRPTVQLALNKAISLVLKEAIQTYGASRTDSQVHAFASFFHFDSDRELDQRFTYQLNSILPFEISVDGLYLAGHPDANARFDAISRSYRYQIYTKKDPFMQDRGWYFPYKINREILEETAVILTEYKNFESFSKRNTQSKTFNCDIMESEWTFLENDFSYFVKANRFLRGMVRALVSTQLQVARGKLTLSEFRQIIESKDCTNANFSAPGHGLYLENIEYPKDYFNRIV